MHRTTPAHGRTAFVLLAAGAGSRWHGHGHKLDARLADGRSVWRTSLETAVEAASRRGARVIVVVGATDLPIAHRRAGDDDAAHVTVETVANPDWRSGQRSSLLVALDRAEHAGADAVVIGLADQPFIGTEAWTAISRSSAPIAVAAYDGVRGHPVRLERALWAEVRELDSPADEGLRSFIGLHPELVEEVPCEGSPTDIDTVEDLDRWT